MKKSTLLMIVSVVLAMTLSLGSTLAYLQDTDSDVNVMTLGNVYIELHEEQWKEDNTALEGFKQEKPLYPAVGAPTGYEYSEDEGKQYRWFTGIKNEVDKYVTVENTGKSPAYVRTLIAFELGQYTKVEDFQKWIGLSRNAINGDEYQYNWMWESYNVYNIDGNNYVVATVTHVDPVAAGATTVPSLLQVYMKKEAGNEQVEKLDGNGNGFYDIMVVAQAVQTAGWDTETVTEKDTVNSKAFSAETGARIALNEAFGPVNEDNVKEWFKGLTPPFEGDMVPEEDADGNIIITNAHELAYVAEQVNSGNDYKDQTIVLANDIDLLGQPWTPIGGTPYEKANGEIGHRAFNGTFDGQGHTVSNFKVDVEMYAGLFGRLFNHGVVKNVTVKNADINANDYAGGVVGWSYGDVENCHAENVTVTVTPYWNDEKNAFDGGAKAGGVVGAFGEGTYYIKNSTAENVTINGYRDLGGVVGMLHNNNTMTDCSAEDVTINYVVMDMADYDDQKTPNENAGKVFGRRGTDVVINGVEDNSIVPNYAIGTADALMSLSNKSLTGTYVLTADIDLNGESIQAIGAAYGKQLTVLGNGHKISNAKVSAGTHNGMNNYGLFYAYTNSTLKISDLVIENVTVEATGANYGAAVMIGYMDGGSNVTLTNVDVKNSTVKNSYDEAAVYVGYQTGTLTMVGCDSTGCTVEGENTTKTGAFIGHVNGSGATLTNCTTDLTINATNRENGTLTIN